MVFPLLIPLAYGGLALGGILGVGFIIDKLQQPIKTLSELPSEILDKLPEITFPEIPSVDIPDISLQLSENREWIKEQTQLISKLASKPPQVIMPEMKMPSITMPTTSTEISAPTVSSSPTIMSGAGEAMGGINPMMLAGIGIIALAVIK